jgi:hypothetical protein
MRIRSWFALCCLALAVCTAATGAGSASSDGVVAVEYTFLKSLPGQHKALQQFIVANWFAMDDKAIAQGQIRSYQLLSDEGGEGGEGGEDWDVVVAVTYHNRSGYEGIAGEFEKIRQAHRTVSVDGKTLRDLGRITGSRKLLLHTASQR